MNMTTTYGKTIGLTIPDEYYRKLGNIRFAADNKCNRSGRPITSDQVYSCFRTLMEKLGDWLSDQVEGTAYRTIKWSGNSVTLQETDNPFDAYWTNIVIDHISDQFRFGGLLDRWQNDP